MENNSLTLEQETSREEKLFKIWETIKAGTHKSASEICTVLKDKGDIIGCSVEGLLKKYSSITSRSKEIDLIDVLVIDLGFSSGATYREICLRAAKLGLSLCPFEVALILCLQHSYSLKSEWLCIAMEPLKDLFERPTIFKVEYNWDKSHLDVACGYPYFFWGSKQHFIFCYD